MIPKIGWIPIHYYSTSKLKYCEAPLHYGMKLEAFAVIAVVSNDYPDTLVQIVCKDCWDQFDKDLGSPNWNLKERKND